jgi:hypothetical protein
MCKDALFSLADAAVVRNSSLPLLLLLKHESCELPLESRELLLSLLDESLSVNESLESLGSCNQLFLDRE